MDRLSISEAAATIGCSPRYVRHLISVDTLPARREPYGDGWSFHWTVALQEALKYRGKPQGKGFPRGRKRNKNRTLKVI